LNTIEVQNIYEEMLLMFGKLPDHIHHPIQFAHFVKLYRYYKEKEV